MERDKPKSVFIMIVCGAVSSTCGQILSYPLALCKTRLQATGTVVYFNNIFFTGIPNIIL